MGLRRIAQIKGGNKMTEKLLLTLDENKELSINSKNTDEIDVLYMLMIGLIHSCKEVEIEQELIIKIINEAWGSVE